MAVNGNSTNENGDSLLISLQSPYENVVEVLGFTDVIKGETTSCYYVKDFRWGIDGVTYSDWATLTDIALESLQLNPKNKFWIQYRYTQVGDCTLTFESIALEVVTDGGVICKIPQIDCNDLGTCSGAMNLVFDCCGTSWNPYDISRAGQMYEQLSAMASNIFGFCVDYYKTKADQRSRDVILKEYSLFDVIKEGEIKIMVPDNELPTRDIQFNPLMMDFPVQFEIHIVKSAFEAVFGVGSKPQMRDYLYFKQFMNRMYEVDAVAQSDDFLYTGAYWRVSLVQYQKRTNVGYENTVEGEAAEASTEALISNVEDKFRVERENEFKDVRKPNEYNTIGSQANDYVRRALNKKLTIQEENLYNAWTIVSKYHYALSTIPKGAYASKYRYNLGWRNTDNRAFSFWFRPTYNKPIGKNVLITQISNNAGDVMFTTSGLPTGSDALVPGDWISVRGTNSYNGIQKVKSVDEATDTVTLDLNYIDNVMMPTAKFSHEVSNKMIRYHNNAAQPVDYFEITYTTNWFIIKVNNVYHKFDLSKESLVLKKGEWYAAVININNLANQLSLFLYTPVEIAGAINPDRTANLTKS